MLSLRILLPFICSTICQICFCQQSKNDTAYLLTPDHVFDGEQMHDGWQVLIKNNKIEAAGKIDLKTMVY